MNKIKHWRIAVVLLVSLPTGAQAAMTEADKQVYVMAVDPAGAGSEYAIAATAKEKIVIIIPPTVADTVADNGTERELVAAFVRLNFIFTGRMRLLIPPRWFEFEDVNTKQRYRFFEKDKTTITALFVDGSTVRFRFWGTAINCPSGQCFEWVVGSETRPIIRPPSTQRPPARPPRNGSHPGKDRGRHSPPPGGGGGALPGRPHDPYDPKNWPRPRPGRQW